MTGLIILSATILFLSFGYIHSEKEILVNIYRIRKTKKVKIVESVFAILGVLAYYMNLINYYWISNVLLIVAVIWQFIVIYVRNNSALDYLHYNGDNYIALKKELWKEYLYIIPKTIFFVIILHMLLMY
ncbi:hypothetical protein [Veillonella tobetsuensis]|jgi:hypothetical protein|uniref:Uncharacterized protein n=2 Tax=Veillonella tobetsuensis TaxID=1110546 RepID=A0A2S7ZNM9_9FIRM|nr:hypothetical protein [Veillonella tobetsuensis]PQL24889.1 hypothetical protein VTHSUH11_07860 [Veillonella tobetsuensis]